MEKVEKVEIEVGQPVAEGESFWGSEISEDRLSIREVGKVKKWMSDKKRMERRNNIILKGIEVYKISR